MKHKITVTTLDDGESIYTVELPTDNYEALREFISVIIAKASFVSFPNVITLVVEKL